MTIPPHFPAPRLRGKLQLEKRNSYEELRLWCKIHPSFFTEQWLAHLLPCHSRYKRFPINHALAVSRACGHCCCKTLVSCKIKLYSEAVWSYCFSKLGRANMGGVGGVGGGGSPNRTGGQGPTKRAPHMPTIPVGPFSPTPQPQRHQETERPIDPSQPINQNEPSLRPTTFF